MRSSHHRNHHARRLLCLTALACFVVGGTAYACTRKAAVPQLPELPAESLAQPAENGAQQSTLTAAQAQALLDDPRMILVNRTHKMPEDYPVETKECGSATDWSRHSRDADCADSVRSRLNRVCAWLVPA